MIQTYEVDQGYISVHSKHDQSSGIHNILSTIKLLISIIRMIVR